MQRLTISLDDPLADALDAWMARNGYSNRSEAMRDLIRDALAPGASEGPTPPECVAALSYVYDFDGRDLALRLERAQHAHHDIVISSMRTRLDHRHCMEVTLLRGPTARVSELGRTILAEKGVRFGRINLVPVRHDDHGHSHGHGGPHHHHDTPAL
jgi:CopG family transcriptional regulator, nickel-responsive regulator